MMTGSGGWPLTVLMTPEQKPFFAGTYFPKNDRFGRPGLIQLLERASELWKTERDVYKRQHQRLLAENESNFSLHTDRLRNGCRPQGAAA